MPSSAHRTTDLELPTAPFGPTPLRTLRNEVAAREQSLVADSGQLPPAANSGSKQRSLPSRCDDRVAQPLNRVEAQQQMEAVTDKWGIRIDRIEILAIAPPPKILEALALEKRAVQEKRAKIRQSEGQQQAAINVAEGEAQAAVRTAQAQAAILRVEGSRQAAILEAEGRSQAISTVYAAIKKGDPADAGGDPPTRRPRHVRRQ
jgi:hypothetical protein